MPLAPPSPKRSGAYLVSRAVKSRAAGALSLAEYGLLNRIWDDLRWTPKRVQTRTGWFDLQAGQAVISVGAYASEFRCHHRVITRGLDALQAAGWFRAESSKRGTIVTCLVDPRDCQPRPQEAQDAIEEVRPTVAEGVRPLVADPVRPLVAEGVRPLVADPLTTLSRGIHQAVSTPGCNAPGSKAPGADVGRSLGGASQNSSRGRDADVAAPVAAGDLAFLADGRRGVVVPASTAEPALAVPVSPCLPAEALAKACPPVPMSAPTPAGLPQAWPAIARLAAEAGVSEACARGEALREEFEHHRPAVQVVAELLDMHPKHRDQLKLPPLLDPDGYLRGWRQRPIPERTYGDAKRVFQHYGLSLRPATSSTQPQTVGELLPAAAAPP